MPSLVEATFVCTFCFINSTETQISANARISGDMRTHLKWPALLPVFTSFLFTCLSAPTIMAQAPEIFRLDGGRSTYAFGVNERGELQTLYWGASLGPRDKIPLAHSLPEWASFDSSYSNTPQEYSGWGGGLFTEPALKVAFADGNRDLVLHFVDANPNGPQSLEILLKDISREVYVRLRYSMDSETGIHRVAQPHVNFAGNIHEQDLKRL